jgi:putative ABC transport system substrate-binding protein
MKRRDFIAGFGVIAAWPLAARAQQPQKQHRIALVHSGIPADKLIEKAGPFWIRRFHETLRALGDVEGGALVIDRYSAEGRSERFAPLAAEVVGRKPDVIISNLNDLIKSFMAATGTIPIVAIIGDPIAGGFVTNLAHPGGNLTGVSINAGIEIQAKRLKSSRRHCPRRPKSSICCRGTGTTAPES